MQTYEAILAFNRRAAPNVKIEGQVVFSAPLAGSIIHRIGIEDAKAISTIVKVEEAKTFIPRTLSLAFMGNESMFDPEAINKNYNLMQENKARWDVGVGQLNIGVLSREKALALNGDLEAAETFAYDITKAIPWKFKLIIQNLLWAKAFLAANPTLKMDALYLSLIAYNRGRTGAARAIAAGEISFPYADGIVRTERWFATALKLQSVFANRVLPEDITNPK